MVLYFFLAWALYGFGLVASQKACPVTGVRVSDPSKGVPMRRNINDLQNEAGPQWDLYIQALAAMYKDDPSDQLSYFQIAGIHGEPYIQWNGAGPGTGVVKNWQGYCPHGEDIFLPWHRAFVLLFEQRLVDKATSLANAYPTSYRAQYIQAAQTLRAPYWDWAQNSTVPPATVPSTVKVNIANGTKVVKTDFNNPLMTYLFPQFALSGSFGAFDKRKQIQRCTSPQKYPDSANKLLDALNLKKQLYDTLTMKKTFDNFGSKRGDQSVESIHDSIHSVATCGNPYNQFADQRLSAFDPLFMLHHSNMDRLWAYWQFMWPAEASFQGSYSGGARFATPDKTTITPTSPLQPFFASLGKFHTTQTIQSIKTFGYTYQGLEWWKKSAAQLQTDSKALINQLYSPTNLKAVPRPAGKLMSKTRYFLEISVNVEDLPRPCTLTFFVDSNVVGNMYIMTQPQKGTTGSKFSLDDVVVTDQSVKRKPQAVVDGIIKGVRVKATKSDGSNIPVSSVQSLKMKIENVVVVLPKTTKQLPQYGQGHLKPAPNKQQGPRDVE